MKKTQIRRGLQNKWEQLLGKYDEISVGPKLRMTFFFPKSKPKEAAKEAYFKEIGDKVNVGSNPERMNGYWKYLCYFKSFEIYLEIMLEPMKLIFLYI